MTMLLLNILIRLYIVTNAINFFSIFIILTSFIQFTNNNQQIFTTYLAWFIALKVIFFFTVLGVSISMVFSTLTIAILHNFYLTEIFFNYFRTIGFKNKIYMACGYIISKKEQTKEKFNYCILFKNNILLGAIFFPKKEYNNYTGPKYETYSFGRYTTVIPPRHPFISDELIPIYAIIFFLILIFFFRCWENRYFIYYNRFYGKPYIIRFTRWYGWRKNHILFLLKFLEIRMHIVFKPMFFLFNRIGLYFNKIWQKFDSWIINFFLLLSFIYYIACFLFFLPFLILYFLFVSLLIKLITVFYHKIYKKLIHFYTKKFKSK